MLYDSHLGVEEEYCEPRCMSHLLYVACCTLRIRGEKKSIVGQVDAILWLSWDDFGATRTCLGAILGLVRAILGQSWEVLGATWVHLGAGSSSMESIFFWRALLENAVADFAYKTNGFVLMVLQWHCSPNIKITYLLEMPKSLSLVPCAVKSLFSANINAKRSIGVNRKCV